MKISSDNVKKILLLLIVAAVFVVIFYRVANRPRQAEEGKLSQVQNVLQRDLDYNYPPSPREVVRYYAELSQCLYLADISDKEIEDIGIQMRELFDSELKDNQPQSDYLNNLKVDVAMFREEQRKVISFTISSSTDVEFSETDKGDLATLYCMFTMQKGNQNYSDNEHFILRKDERGHWKILGWQPA
ncbi:MAG: hypothetical protein J6O71_01580 [Lachnospiraceae bacterium]|nr:hypothetical protein [Lachnospiraceae bacterium]